MNRIGIKVRTLLLLALVAPALPASEGHVDRVVGAVQSAVRQLKAADPEAVAIAIWDFDGTIIRGDVTEGLFEDGRERFQGMAHAGILAGWSGIYRGESGWEQYLRDYARLNEIGRFIAWPYNAQMFAGPKAAEFDAFCRRRFAEVYRNWYFASSMAILRRLEASGIENHIISGSPEIFVRNAADTIGLPASRFNGIRVAIDNGRITTRIEYPVLTGEGKVELLKHLLNARKHAYAIAGFGDSYKTDGPFLRYIATQDLPGGARGFAMMINAKERPAEYEGLLFHVRQSETEADAGRD